MASGLIVGAALGALFVSSGLLARHQAVFDTFSLAQIQEVRDYTARHTGSGVVLDYDLQSASGFALSVIVGWAHLLLAPFPWQLGRASLRMLLAMPDTVVWWWILFAGLVPGVRVALRARFSMVLPIVLFVLGLGTLYSITFSNIGLILRYRAQLMPWLLIISMVGMEQRAARRLFARQAQAARARVIRFGPIAGRSLRASLRSAPTSPPP